MKSLPVAVFVAVIAGTALYFVSPEKITPSINLPPVLEAGLDMSAQKLTEEKSWWEERLKNEDPVMVYENFKETYKHLDLPMQHGLAHIFGEALYNVMGIGGVSMCDKSFSSGCFHSFLGSAIREKGTEIIEELDDACYGRFKDKAVMCQHGIGHGLLVELGYDKLTEALSLCNTLRWPQGYAGCKDGVFMEYNQHTLGDEQVRELTGNNIYEPCESVEVIDKSACYYALPQWWLNLGTDNYLTIGSRCDVVAEEDSRRACFWGLGVIVTGYNYGDAVSVKRECELLKDMKDGVSLCLESSAWAASGGEDLHMREKICEPLAGSTVEYEWCVHSSRLIKN